MKGEKRLAIIKEVGFGNRDVGEPVLFFTAMIDECEGALQVLFGKEATDLIKAYGVYDVKNMEGKPIWVEKDGGMIKVVGAWV